MTFDPREFVTEPSPWFSTDIEYEGWGRAEFSDPAGSLEGPVVVRSDELGVTSIEMSPDPNTLRSERELRFALDEFLSGEQPTQVDGTWVLSRTLESRNPCTRLDVETSQGNFSSQEITDYGVNAVYGGDVTGGGVQKITFEVLWSEFAALDTGEPKYWVIPLTNFVSDFRWYAPSELNHHTLRVFPTPEVPDEITHVVDGPGKEEREQRALLALMAANSRNRLITFESDVSLGFIERLPEYEERRDSLLEGDRQTRLTAVMVGEVGSHASLDFGELESWLHPFDLLTLLTLATGTEVGAPWIELRDADGKLVRRLHRRLREPRFRKGHRIVDELPIKNEGAHPTGTGRLITRATSRSDKFGEAYLRVAIVNLVRSRYTNQTLEESVVYLTRALDGLCEHYSLARQDLLSRLDTEQQKIVTEVLGEAAKKIRDLKIIARDLSDHKAGASLATIEGRIPNVATTERKFGLAVTDLMELFGLPDAHVVDEHYSAHPRTDGRQYWSDVVSNYRGRVIHNGYLDLAGGTEWRDVWTFINHLHDITARIILQILEYDGGYQPTVVPIRSVPYSLDWVKPDTPAGALGYRPDRVA